MSLGEERFPFDTPSPWEQDIDKKLKWCEALESTGPENVRLILGQIPTGARSSISVGEVSMAKGYANDGSHGMIGGRRTVKAPFGLNKYSGHAGRLSWHHSLR